MQLVDGVDIETYGHASPSRGKQRSCVFGLRAGPWAYPRSDRSARVPPRCSKLGPARIDRFLGTDTASPSAASSVDCVQLLRGYAMQMRNSMVTGSNRYLMLLVYPMNEAIRQWRPHSWLRHRPPRSAAMTSAPRLPAARLGVAGSPGRDYNSMHLDRVVTSGAVVSSLLHCVSSTHDFDGLIFGTSFESGCSEQLRIPLPHHLC